MAKTHDYRITIRPHDAALYLAWEYGFRRANILLKEILPRTIPRGFSLGNQVLLDAGKYRPLLVKHTRRKDAEIYAALIRQVIAYQQGRLRKSLGPIDVAVVDFA